jgi:hypothetical protein
MLERAPPGCPGGVARLANAPPGRRRFGSAPRVPWLVDVCTCSLKEQAGSTPTASGTRHAGAFPDRAYRPLRRSVGANEKPATNNVGRCRPALNTSPGHTASQSSSIDLVTLRNALGVYVRFRPSQPMREDTGMRHAQDETSPLVPGTRWRSRSTGCPRAGPAPGSSAAGPPGAIAAPAPSAPPACSSATATPSSSTARSCWSRWTPTPGPAWPAQPRRPPRPRGPRTRPGHLVARSSPSRWRGRDTWPRPPPQETRRPSQLRAWAGREAWAGGGGAGRPRRAGRRGPRRGRR